MIEESLYTQRNHSISTQETHLPLYLPTSRKKTAQADTQPLSDTQKHSNQTDSDSDSIPHCHSNSSTPIIKIYDQIWIINSTNVSDIQRQLQKIERQQNIKKQVWLPIKLVLAHRLCQRSSVYCEMLGRFIEEYSSWKVNEFCSAIAD